MSEDSRMVQLSGGSPWGLRIQGGADFRAPLKVTKVSPGGKAALAGVQVSDVIKEIGETDCATLRHSEALYLIRTSGNCLSLRLLKGGSGPAPYQPPNLPAPLVASPVKKPVYAASYPTSPAKKPVSVISNPTSPSKKPVPFLANPVEVPVPSVANPVEVPVPFVANPVEVPVPFLANPVEVPVPFLANPVEVPVPSVANPVEVPVPSAPVASPRKSPGRVPESTGFERESAGGKDWYRAMHRAPQTYLSEEVAQHFTYDKEEKEAPKPRPIKPKPRSFQLTAPPPSSPPSQSPSVPSQSPSLPSQSPSLLPATYKSATSDPCPDTSQPTNGSCASPPSPSGSPEYAVPSDQSNSAESDSKAPVSEGGKRRGGKRKRELKPPPSDWARALYDFGAETKHELSFKKGATLRLLRTVDENWLEAQLGGVKGIIPVSYVELSPSPPAPSPPGPSGPHALALYDFAAEESYELAFQKGQLVALLSRVDENWMQGRVADKTGIFPAAFVEVLVPLEEITADRLVENEIRTRLPAQTAVPAQTAFPAQTAVPAQTSVPAQTAVPAQSNVLPQGEMFRAVFSYAPQNSDELALSPGTEVMVVRKCEDGWFMGYSEETGAFGTFPGNYVEPTT